MLYSRTHNGNSGRRRVNDHTPRLQSLSPTHLPNHYLLYYDIRHTREVADTGCVISHSRG